jgi:polysaccharide biosynthesis protein PslG
MPTNPTSRLSGVTRRRAALLAAVVALAAAGVGATALLRDAPENRAAPQTMPTTTTEPEEERAPAIADDTETPVFTPPAAPAEDEAPTTTEETTPAPEPERTEPMLVGFMDDASFRWRPSRARMLDRARASGARIVRALVRWDVAAPERPARGRRPFVVPRMYELDELVAGAEARGMEVLFTIWGTPAWANRGQEPNHAPTDLDALREFAHGLAERYPSVRRYSIWNEPNTNLFLAPQFDARGRSVAPRTYAALYRAAYEGIKDANSDALVAIGETGSHGRDAPSPGPGQDRHSPARFAQLLSKEDLEFDAWAHHPYPISPGVPPDGAANWPNVTLPSLGRFARALETWFGRDEIPLWITEFGYEVSPAEPFGVPQDVQAERAERAIELAAAEPRVAMFVWFTFADSEHNTWQSGLLDATGRKRPLYERFAAAVRAYAAS